MHRHVATLLLLVVQPAFALNNHPRIWLDTATSARLASKVTANDPNWTRVLSYANAALNYKTPLLTIIGATNSNPVQFTTSGTMPLKNGQSIYFGGGTGAVCSGLNSWTCLNTPTAWSGHAPFAWSGVATITGAQTFTVPLDSTNFGSF